MHTSIHIQQVLRRTATTLRGGPTSLVFTLIFAACSQATDEGPVYEEVRFATQWETATSRSSLDNRWDEGDVVRIHMYGLDRAYMAAADGSLTAVDTPFYWETKDAAQVSGSYSLKQPVTDKFKIETGQDKSGGMATSDAMYAPPVTVDYGETAHLKFLHLTARVDLRVTASEEVGDINMSNAYIFFINQQDESGAINLTTGEVAQVTNKKAQKYITPAAIEGASNAVEKNVRALLVPQYGSDIPFIQVEFRTDGTATATYVYTPTEAAPINLEAGKQYTMNVTLTRRGLELSSVSVTPWQTTIDNVDAVDRTYDPSTSGSPVWDTTTEQVTPTERN